MATNAMNVSDRNYGQFPLYVFTTSGIWNTPEGRKSVIALFHSMDGVNFNLSKGTMLNPGDYKDFDLGLLARSKYRKYLFVMAGMIDNKATINYLESMVDKEYANTKMR